MPDRETGKETECLYLKISMDSVEGAVTEFFSYFIRYGKSPFRSLSDHGPPPSPPLVYNMHPACLPCPLHLTLHQKVGGVK